MIRMNAGSRSGAYFGVPVLALILAAAAYPSWNISLPTSLTPEDVARTFCAPVASAALVPAGHAVDHELSVRVPPEPPTPGIALQSIVVGEGSVVSISAFSQYAGAVGVHRLSEIAPIHSGKPVTITFRAAFTGRFPVHFHGTDGAHFEIATVEVGLGQASMARGAQARTTQ